MLILAPLLQPGYLLYRDAVSTPRSFITDAALGIGELAPRAVPQDWFVALASSFIDGGVVVIAILAGALLFGAVGYGRLAARLLPGLGRTPAIVAAVAAVWNPYVAERLLQGHWGLLVALGALGWIIVAVLDLHRSPRSATRWCQLGALLAVAGLTPTGSVLALIISLTVGITTAANLRWRLRTALAVCGLWLLTALTWLTAALFGGASLDSAGAAGVAAFSLRSEPLLGPLGTAAGLGGIWNGEAVPTSRGSGWALVATLALLSVVLYGGIALWRRRSAADAVNRRVIKVLAILAGLTVITIAALSLPAGQSVLAWVINTVPGAGLLRDTQKFSALAVPFVAISAAAAARAAHRRAPAGFVLAAAALLIIAPLPDLAWGVGGKLAPISYPAQWRAVSDVVPAEAGAVAIWPSGTVRRYDFTDDISLDPAPRMLRAPVIESGELRVDGQVVDTATPLAAQVRDVLAAGGDPHALVELGVGWVLVERSATNELPIPSALSQLTPTLAGEQLVLIQLPGASSAPASAAARTAAWAAHGIWLAVILSGALAGPCAAVLRRRSPAQAA